jgi:chemotaxis protein CheX
MDVNYINPFLEGTLDVLKKMAFITAEPGKPYIKKSSVSAGDVSGIIGITGDATGSLALSFTESCICEIVNTMLGENHASINSEIIDAVGELTNMISGSARNLMEKQGIKAFAAIPTVVHGKNHTINAIYNVPSIIIPFSTLSGPFFVDVCIKTTLKEDRRAENYQVINKKTAVAQTAPSANPRTTTPSPSPSPQPVRKTVAAPSEAADRGTILRKKLEEASNLKMELDHQLSQNPFMEYSRRKTMKVRIAEIDASIRRLKLDIKTWEMLSKMDADQLENPHIKTNFQNYPTRQS